MYISYLCYKNDHVKHAQKEKSKQENLFTIPGIHEYGKYCSTFQNILSKANHYTWGFIIHVILKRTKNNHTPYTKILAFLELHTDPFCVCVCVCIDQVRGKNNSVLVLTDFRGLGTSSTCTQIPMGWLINYIASDTCVARCCIILPVLSYIYRHIKMTVQFLSVLVWLIFSSNRKLILIEFVPITFKQKAQTKGAILLLSSLVCLHFYTAHF